MSTAKELGCQRSCLQPKSLVVSGVVYSQRARLSAELQSATHAVAPLVGGGNAVKYPPLSGLLTDHSLLDIRTNKNGGGGQEERGGGPENSLSVKSPPPPNRPPLLPPSSPLQPETGPVAVRYQGRDQMKDHDGIRVMSLAEGCPDLPNPVCLRRKPEVIKGSLCKACDRSEHSFVRFASEQKF